MGVLCFPLYYNRKSLFHLLKIKNISTELGVDMVLGPMGTTKVKNCSLRCLLFLIGSRPPQQPDGGAGAGDQQLATSERGCPRSLGNVSTLEKLTQKCNTLPCSSNCVHFYSWFYSTQFFPVWVFSLLTHCELHYLGDPNVARGAS